MDCVLVRSVERLAVCIAQVERVDRILRQVRTEAHLRNYGALEIVVAVNAHGICVHRPMVRNTSEGRDFPFHEFLSRCRCLLQRLPRDRIGLAHIETLARLDTDPFHLRYNRLISNVRQVDFEKFGCIGEVFISGHGIDLRLRRRFHVDAWIELHLDWLGDIPTPKAA